MTTEDLIIAIDKAAPGLQEAALRLLLRLISISIQSGSAEVQASHRWLAEQIGISREGVARGARDLKELITIDMQHGRVCRFTMPAEWFTPQRSLFAGNEPQKRIHRWPTDQATTGQVTRPALANQPGQHWPNDQAKLANSPGQLANSPGQTGQVTRPTGLETRPPNTQNQQLTDGALIESNRIQILCTGDLVMHIDRCLHTVEIPASQAADAALLSEQLYQYKCALGPLRELSAYPDQQVLARLFAIADIEVLHDRLRKLRANGVHCGKQDMWFFTVLMQKIYGASPKLTASRYDCMNSRKPPMTENLPAFGPELVRQVASGLRRL